MTHGQCQEEKQREPQSHCSNGWLVGWLAVLLGERQRQSEWWWICQEVVKLVVNPIAMSITVSVAVRLASRGGLGSDF